MTAHDADPGAYVTLELSPEERASRKDMFTSPYRASSVSPDAGRGR